jgi:exosortase/archaeosortase family protein
MNHSPIAEIKGWVRTPAAIKLGIWLVISLLLTAVFFRDFWTSLPLMLSPAWIADFHTAQWGVLVICIIFLYLKRKQVNLKEAANLRSLMRRFFPGAVLVAGAVLIPPHQDYLLLKVLLASLGVFYIIFGRGAKIPAILAAVFAFSVLFPIGVKYFFEEEYAQSVLIPLIALLKAIHYPIQNQGQIVSFTSAGGESISVNVSLECAGPITMAIFISLFMLMMLDSPQKPRKAIGLFLFGVIGTWVQSYIRLVILMVIGYHIGREALWTAHYWSVYLLFPLWYLLFAYIYFRPYKRPLVGAGLGPMGNRPGKS